MLSSPRTVWYLAGLIGEGEVLEHCAEWRNNLQQARPAYLYTDPLNGSDLSKVCDKGLTGDFPARTILHRDHGSVRNADGLVACLDLFGSDRGLCGTLFEIAWAYAWHKPVIAFSAERRPEYVRHPFVTECVTALVSSVDEVLPYIDFVSRGLR
jgi:nucleoside 2-deoxyribosyltransferase